MTQSETLNRLPLGGIDGLRSIVATRPLLTGEQNKTLPKSNASGDFAQNLLHWPTTLFGLLLCLPPEREPSLQAARAANERSRRSFLGAVSFFFFLIVVVLSRCQLAITDSTIDSSPPAQYQSGFRSESLPQSGHLEFTVSEVQFSLGFPRRHWH